MSHPAEAYARMLRQLLPTGSAWEMEVGDVRYNMFLAMGRELARIEARAEDLLDEIDPRTSLELLPEWERAVGLPDEIVTSIPATVPERRIAIMQKLLARGGASRQYFIDIAAASGFNITITEYTASVARVGTFRVGQRLYGTAWAYTWLVTVSTSSPALAGWLGQSVFFRVGQGRVGERLRSWNGPVLEALFRLLKPAHTIVQFTYV